MKNDDNPKLKMNNKQFDELLDAQKVTYVNARLHSIENIKDFKSGDHQVTFSHAKAELERLGYEQYGREFVKKITANEIKLIRHLLHESDVYYKAMSLGANIETSRDDEIQVTTVRVYKNVWNKFNEFCKANSSIAKEELLTVALEDFVLRYTKTESPKWEY